jgi:hypothetical protein
MVRYGRLSGVFFASPNRILTRPDLSNRQHCICPAACRSSCEVSVGCVLMPAVPFGFTSTTRAPECPMPSPTISPFTTSVRSSRVTASIFVTSWIDSVVPRAHILAGPMVPSPPALTARTAPCRLVPRCLRTRDSRAGLSGPVLGPAATANGPQDRNQNHRADECHDDGGNVDPAYRIPHVEER